jgi:hypothetical protein
MNICILAKIIHNMFRNDSIYREEQSEINFNNPFHSISKNLFPLNKFD